MLRGGGGEEEEEDRGLNHENLGFNDLNDFDNQILKKKF